MLGVLENTPRSLRIRSIYPRVLTPNMPRRVVIVLVFLTTGNGYVCNLIEIAPVHIADAYISQTDDYVYCVVFSTGTYTLNLSVGTSSGSFPVVPGVNKFKLSMSTGSPVAQLIDSSGKTVLSFSSGFPIVSDPLTYSFNYYIAASP